MVLLRREMLTTVKPFYNEYPSDFSKVSSMRSFTVSDVDLFAYFWYAYVLLVKMSIDSCSVEWSVIFGETKIFF
jgi:hypothetical protein